MFYVELCICTMDSWLYSRDLLQNDSKVFQGSKVNIYIYIFFSYTKVPVKVVKDLRQEKKMFGLIKLMTLPT